MSSKQLDKVLDMTDRVQLNLRLDGRRDLLKAIKEVATTEGLSVNAWVIKTLESAINPAPNSTPQPLAHTSIPDIEALVDKMLDEKLAAKFPDTIELTETVAHALTTPEEALAHAAIFGFTPEEALADVHFQLNMLTSNYDELEDKYDALKRDRNELEQQMSELQNEIVFKNSQLSELQADKQSAPGVETFPEAAELYNQFKAQNKKSKTTLADTERLLRLLQDLKHKNLHLNIDNCD
ncbi:hypothetical protein [Microcoleus sp. D3_18_C4]|uniref:hypothetical protein n=1 Tax=Microcoleus sp. D3_18_C4 TaxID=3055335 RepID=UPI002FD3B3A5